MNQTFDNFRLGVKTSDRDKNQKRANVGGIANNIQLVDQAVHAHGKVFMNAKAPKLYVSLQNCEKFLVKNIVGDVLKTFRGVSCGGTLCPKILLETPGSTRPWKSSFSSESNE